jgi:hypothetical protein
MTYALILYIYAGVMARGDSVTLYSVPMQSLAVCEQAGKAAEGLVRGSLKEYRYVCVKTGQ